MDAVEAMLMEYEKTFSTFACMDGYHIYKYTWKATIGDKTPLHVSKPGNTHNQYTVAVGRNIYRTVKSHLPQKTSYVCTLFMKKDGHHYCRVTGEQ